MRRFLVCSYRRLYLQTNSAIAPIPSIFFLSSVLLKISLGANENCLRRK
ncbi:hypothetical protein GCWU000325_00601 [Alloprevotella tannerae ATCC 51259]|uniref:Uncharacterized protein n=1 Tax=Alloprevotella tannerae ATCC 51259 TaxID=626522 RepID=C9LEH5_9BACT|nr:hypothetical protein GCWU000325_00601 [Alloprevotella tannerae ATCC 51259]